MEPPAPGVLPCGHRQPTGMDMGLPGCTSCARSGDAGRGQRWWQGTRTLGDTGTLTGDGGAVARLVRHDELVLEAAAPHALRPDQHQCFPAERWHPRHLLIDQQLMAVELCTRDRAVTPSQVP